MASRRELSSRRMEYFTARSSVRSRLVTPKSSSMLTPKKVAILGRRVTSGVPLPTSHRETVWGVR